MFTAQSKISFINGHLQVPDHPIIPYIVGDGIGPEIWAATERVINAAVKKAYQSNKAIEWHEVLAGEKARDLTGEWLPGATVETIKESLVALKGPLTTPVGGGIRSINVALRKSLDLYACVRPIRYFSGVPSVVKNPRQVDIVVFRENTEDIYTGIEYPCESEEVKMIIKMLQEKMGREDIRFPDTSAIGFKLVSKQGSTRLIRAAIDYALKEGRSSVTLVHKGNIMKHTEGAFKNWGYELARNEFGDRVFTMDTFYELKARDAIAADAALEQAKQAGKLIIKDVIADNFLQQILLAPQNFDVIATLNLNGDYISDAIAAQVGGIGIAPGANINYITGHAVFEATHGTAPDIAGLNKANPSSLILSAEMMLRYMGWTQAADLIINTMEKTLSEKKVTADLACFMDDAHTLNTSEFADALIDNL